MDYELNIPYTPPSLNIWHHLHWAQRLRFQREWTEAIWALCNEPRVPPMDKVHLSATIYFKENRRRDHDNFESTLKKMAQDALVKIGIISDDTSAYVEWGAINLSVDKHNPRTELVMVSVAGTGHSA